MAKLQIPKKIRFEDFDSQYKEIIEKIGYAFNPFSDEVYQALNGNLGFENLNRELVDVDIQTDSSGKLVSNPKIKTKITGKVRGINTINAINQVNSSTYPLSTPFISFTINADILTILSVTGIQPSSQYKLTLELIV